jgi:hypothetical protein
VVSDGTLLYTNSGQVWDPKSKTLVGRYDTGLFYEPGIVADPVANRTFILRTYGQDGSPAIASYDPSTLTLSGQLSFKVSQGLGSLVRWGNNGFAFLTNTTYGDFDNPSSESQLVVVRSSLVDGNTPVVAVSPGTLTFATLPVGASAEKTLTVQDVGSVAVANIAVAVTGGDAAQFNAVSSCGSTLTAGGTCNVKSPSSHRLKAIKVQT